jgi:autotransporter-associated beta strand protein
MRKQVAVIMAAAAAAASVTFGFAPRTNAQFVDNFDNGSVANTDTIPNFWTTGDYNPSTATYDTVTEAVGGPMTMSYAGPLTLTGSVQGGPNLNGAVSNEFNFFQHPVDITMTAAPGGTLVPGTDTSGSSAETYISIEAQTGRPDYGPNRYFVQVDGENTILFAIKGPNNNTEYNYTIFNNATTMYPAGSLYNSNIHVTSLFMYLDGTKSATGDFYVNFGENWVNVTNNQSGTFSFETRLGITTPYDVGPGRAGFQADLPSMQAAFTTAGGGVLGTEVLNAASNLNSNESVSIGQITDIPTETWNNSTAAILPADGMTWDSGTNANWENSNLYTNTDSNVTYTDGNAVQFTDQNNGNYAVNLTTTVHPGAMLVNNSLGNYTISGTGSIAGTASLRKNGTGTLTLSTANTFSGGTSVDAGTLVIAPTATPATSSALGTGPLTINNGTQVILKNGVTAGSATAGSPHNSSVTMTALAINGNGTLDIGNNHILINYGSGTDPIASIASWIQTGYNGGAWTGTGITSTAAQTNPAYGIGYADSADTGNPAGLASGQIEVMYTLLGDANLDGKVNGADFAILATNFNKAVTGVSGWDQGDFNYDGKINGADFAALAGNFNKGASGAADTSAVEAFAQANGLSLTTSVPEPAALGLLLLGSAGGWRAVAGSSPNKRCEDG